MTVAASSFPGARPTTTDKISRIGMWVTGSALGISFVLVLLLMSMEWRRRGIFGFLPGLAFWGGIPISVTLFITGFFRTTRRQSIFTMVIAVIAGIAWFFVAFFSMALMMGEG